MNVSSHSPYSHNNSRRNIDVKTDSKEKDMLISQLKAHIFELEQHDKDYDNLNKKFRNIQNECSLLNEEKLRLEYELKQRNEAQNKQLSDLRTENENLQLSINDKIAMNKKLYNDNNNLVKNLELRNSEFVEARGRLEDYLVQINKLQSEKSSMERMIQNLNDLKTSQKLEISKLVEDNQKLSRICQNQENQINNLESERVQILSRNDELNFELKNLSGKSKSLEDNLNFAHRQIEDTKSSILKYQQTLKDYEKQIDNQRHEISNLNNSFQKERNNRIEGDKSNEHLQILLNERSREINRLNSEYDNLKSINIRHNEEKNSIGDENERLKNHIMILTEQNEKLMQELETILEQDERIRQQLAKKERTINILNNNKSSLEKSLSNLDDFLNRSNRMMSPNYGLNRSKGNITN